MTHPTPAPQQAAPLTPAQCLVLQDVLLQRQRAVQAELALREGDATRVQHARDVLQQDGDDAPARAADREVDLALNDQEHHELAEIDAALQRLASGHYGSCAACGEAIPIERLRVQPQARRCLACETSAESHAHLPQRATL